MVVPGSLGFFDTNHHKTSLNIAYIVQEIIIKLAALREFLEYFYHFRLMEKIK